jgi:hypothetical protein
MQCLNKCGILHKLDKKCKQCGKQLQRYKASSGWYSHLWLCKCNPRLDEYIVKYGLSPA